jgi:hypothetical protein
MGEKSNFLINIGPLYFGIFIGCQTKEFCGDLLPTVLYKLTPKKWLPVVMKNICCTSRRWKATPRASSSGMDRS